ncbi:MAG: ABC transporter permease, partial [Chromatiales bacterium]
MAETNDKKAPSAAALQPSKTQSGDLVVAFSGDWELGQTLPETRSALDAIASLPAGGRIKFDATALGGWDTGLIVALSRIEESANKHNIEIDHSGLPEGAAKLLHLAFAVGERSGAKRSDEKSSLVNRIGKATSRAIGNLKSSLAFLGKFMESLGRFFTGKANYQRNDLWVTMQEAGAEALPIVGLISFLIGIIFAFVGVIQLNKFGAGIFVADLVAVGMVREMGPIMTGIIMAGRTGAAFA